MANELDVFMMGVDGEMYKQLLQIAQATGKSVTEVAGEALSKHVANAKQLKESSEKKILCEG